ncbi:hypothetical protein GCM10017056_44130 [Seohaeicola zhoushanensis]|uniref:Uncharacterized protein n=1 Tax=Seohaeicola zhoushanensis TaxID=1569283 RepID=A0A8J3H2E7_9RHOB|nr:hypothetical protein GCM10017056_44130 [Seohaeicola zhoushanensis]
MRSGTGSATRTTTAKAISPSAITRAHPIHLPIHPTMRMSKLCARRLRKPCYRAGMRIGSGAAPGGFEGVLVGSDCLYGKNKAKAGPFW